MPPELVTSTAKSKAKTFAPTTPPKVCASAEVEANRQAETAASFSRCTHLFVAGSADAKFAHACNAIAYQW